jgi:TolA-binding protein
VSKPSVETTAQPMTEKPVESAEERAEKDAARKLKLAKGFFDDKKWDGAKTRLEEIIEKFPKTKAATQAKQLLEKIKE